MNYSLSSLSGTSKQMYSRELTQLMDSLEETIVQADSVSFMYWLTGPAHTSYLGHQIEVETYLENPLLKCRVEEIFRGRILCAIVLESRPSQLGERVITRIYSSADIGNIFFRCFSDHLEVRNPVLNNKDPDHASFERFIEVQELTKKVLNKTPRVVSRRDVEFVMMREDIFSSLQMKLKQSLEAYLLNLQRCSYTYHVIHIPMDCVKWLGVDQVGERGVIRFRCNQEQSSEDYPVSSKAKL